MKTLKSLTLAATLIGLASAAFAQPVPFPREKPPEYRLPPIFLEAVALADPLDTDAADWGVADLNFPAAWQAGYTGKGQVVAVLDTGGMSTHRDLKGQILAEFDETGEGITDVSGHGTWCVGSIVAAKNNWGMIGAAYEAKAITVKVLAGRQGTGGVDGIARGIRRAVDWRGPNGERVAVISMSLGGGGQDSYIPPALAYARQNGVIVVAAAGNSGPGSNTVGYPGGYATVVCVAAHDVKRVTASFSSRGTAVFVSGPGVSSRAPFPGPGDGLFGTMSGTSMATPRLGAAAAVWAEANKTLPWNAGRCEKFVVDLQASCLDINTPGRDTLSGYGVPDVLKLVKATTPPQPPANGNIVITLDDLTPAARARILAQYPTFTGISVGFTPTAPKSVRPESTGPRFETWNIQGRGPTRMRINADGSGTAIDSPVPAPLPTFPSFPAPQFQFPPSNCPGGVCPAPQPYFRQR